MNLCSTMPATALLALLLLASTTAQAQDCTIPAGFDRTIKTRSLVDWSGAAGTTCQLRSQFTSTTDPQAAGVAPYRLGGVQQARLSFTLDFSRLDVSSLNRNVNVLTISGTQFVLTGSYVLKAFLMGDGTGGKQIRLLLPQPADTSTGYQAVDIPLGSVTTAQIGLDLQLGSAGYLNYWVNADFVTPPTGRIPASGYLDFSARGPATGLALGLHAGSLVFRSANLAKELIIGDIVVTDYLFRSRFE